MPTALSGLERWLPPPLLRPGPLDLVWWQWLALPGLLILAWLLAPLTLFWSVAAAWALKLPLGLSSLAEGRVDRVLRVAAVVTLFWAAIRAADVGFRMLAETPTAKASGIGRGLLPMLR